MSKIEHMHKQDLRKESESCEIVKGHGCAGAHEESCKCNHPAGGCSCGHDHHEEGCSCGHQHRNDESAKTKIWRMTAALMCFVLGIALPASQVIRTILLILCYLIAGYDVLLSALRSMGNRKMLDENFLMAAASLAAMAIGEMTEGCAVMLFYQVGESFQDYAVGRSRRQIKALLEIRPEEAFVLRDEEYVSVDPAFVGVGEEIRIRPGERVPLDAVVLSGVSEMDTSALTGESAPRNAEPGDVILAGFVSKNGVVTARVEKPLSESSVSRILNMVEDAQARKAKVERFITVFARLYTPIVVGLAVVLAVLPPVLFGEWRVWFYRALTFLVASCPCALVLSVPLCYFAGIGSAARKGILIKGGDSLDALLSVKQFVLDKTGTLTTGRFDVCHVHPCESYSQEEVLALIAGIEKDSRHPLAVAAVEAAEKRGTPPVLVTLEKEIAGRGVQGRLSSGEMILAGNAALMQENGIETDEAVCMLDCARIYAAKAEKLVGFICLKDVVKPGAKDALLHLQRLGIEKTVMLTGDREAPAQALAAELGISEVHAQLLPEDKLHMLEDILKAGGTAFVGDGINDAPALTRADVGIAMGTLGSDAAIEAADVVLMTDEMDRLAQVLITARRVRSIAHQNIVIALGIKIAVLLLAVLGMAGMWAAVFADVGVALICVINAMRAMR